MRIHFNRYYLKTIQNVYIFTRYYFKKIPDFKLILKYVTHKLIRIDNFVVANVLSHFYFLLCVFYYLALYHRYTCYMDITYYDMHTHLYELIQNIKITKPLTRDHPSFKTAPLRFGGGAVLNEG